jgi:TrmH family RNA methyltransferase
MPAAPHTPLRIVQSRHNARVKELRAALAHPGAGLLGLEGQHLVEEALRSGIELRTIFVREGSEALLDGLAVGGGTELLCVSEEVLRSAVTTETPQPLAALAVPPVFTLEQLFARSPSLLIVLSGLQDPGNVGTIVRSAEAFGADGLLALPGTASVWNAKSLRASMGSAFRLPVVAAGVGQALELLRAQGVRSLAAVAPGHARAAGSIDLVAPAALWIGNEGSGLSPEIVAACDALVTIPCPGPVESLNAAIAASVLLYEASRQRAQKAHPRPA